MTARKVDVDAMTDYTQSETVKATYDRWNRLAQPYFDWQFEQFGPYLGKRVADVGCGPGNMTGRLSEKALCLCVDHDARMLQVVDERFAGQSNVETLPLSVLDENFVDQMRQRRVDSILCLNFLAHIEDELFALDQMISSLPVGGRLVLLVPAMPSIAGTLEALDGMLRRYDKAMLRQRFSRLPVEMLMLKYFNSAGALGWWLNSRLLKKTDHGESNYTLMNRVIPLLRPLERLAAPPFGLSLIAIVEKTHDWIAARSD